MKKRRALNTIVIIACTTVLVGAIFFFIGYKTAYYRFENAATALTSQTFYATISDIGDHTLLVSGLEVNDINFRSEFIFSVVEETALVWRYTEISFADLEVGDTIAITFTGEIMESYPAQIAQVERIQLLDDEIHVGSSKKESGLYTNN